MKYLTPEEIKNRSEALKRGFAKQAGIRPLPLKGKCLDIFDRNLPNKSAKILDFGTGSGLFLKELRVRGYAELNGSDIGEYIIPEVKSSLRDFKTFDASFEKFPWADETFDAITAWEVFEHLENPHHAIREAWRILKPGGLLFVSMPNIFHIVSRLVFLKRGLFPKWNKTNNHISIFPRGILEKTFLRYFDLREEGYVYPMIALPGLHKISRYLPANQWFGTWVYYVLGKSDNLR